LFVCLLVNFISQLKNLKKVLAECEWISWQNQVSVTFWNS